jgi:hypothetical protein
VKPELELGDDAEVPAPAADGPEQLGVLSLAGPYDAAVGQHDLGRDEVVAGQAVPGRGPAVSAADGEAAQPGGGDPAAGCVEPVLLGGGVELTPPRTATTNQYSRAAVTAATTSVVVAQRAITAGRRSIIPTIQDFGERGDGRSQHRHMLVCPWAWFGAWAWVHRDVGGVELAQRGVKSTHGTDVRRAGRAQLTVMTVRSSTFAVSANVCTSARRELR